MRVEGRCTVLLEIMFTLFSSLIPLAYLFRKICVIWKSFQNCSFGDTKPQPKTFMRYRAQELAGCVESLTPLVIQQATEWFLPTLSKG